MSLYGRDDEVRLIIEDLKANRLVVVTGESGLGSTTLLEEGVLPELRQQGVIALSFRQWQGRKFVTVLRQAIADAVNMHAEEHFSPENDSLEKILHRALALTGRPVVLLLDQFEDYLRAHTRTHLAEEFDAELSNAIASHYGKILIALQEHSLESFGRLSQNVPNLLGYRLALRPFTPEAARQAVQGEVARCGMEIDPAVTEALISCPAAACGSGVRPFSLMRGVTRLIEAEGRLNSSVVSQATLEGHGGPDRAILESFDAQIGELNKNQTELLFRWWTILISPEQLRLSLTEQALTEYAGRLNRFVPATLAKLEAMNLLRTFEAGEVTRYEISHEYLTPVIRDWWQRRELAMIARQRAQFRVRSLSVAGGCIVSVYVLWLLLSK